LPARLSAAPRLLLLLIPADESGAKLVYIERALSVVAIAFLVHHRGSPIVVELELGPRHAAASDWLETTSLLALRGTGPT
jgi:hypothetical protein